MVEFNPALADIVIEAFERCEVRAPSLTAQHMISARRSLNLVYSRLANHGVNLFQVDLESFPLLQGVPTYELPEDTINVLDVYLRTLWGDGRYTDRALGPISRRDYAFQSNKQTESVPSSYWVDRVVPPQITLWATPNETGRYELFYHRMKRMETANPQKGATMDAPYRWLEAVTALLAAHLAIKWKPAKATALDAYAKEVWNEAMDEDRERVTLSIRPNVSSYYE